MMNRMTLMGNQLILMVLFVAIGLGGIGCKKQLADMQKSKYDKKTVIAEKYSPAEHEQNVWDQQLKTKTDADKLYEAQDFENALPLYKEAVALVLQVTEDARRKEAEKRFAIATTEQNVMKQNDGDKEDNALYSDIIKIYKEASDAKTEEGWDTVIEKSVSVKEKVIQLLTSLKNRTEATIEVAKNSRKSMETHNCLIHANKFVEEVDQLIVDSEFEFAFEQRRYHVSIDKAEAAQARAQEGITEAQRVTSVLVIEVIEKRMSEALSKDAEKWVKDNWNTAIERQEEMMTVHNDDKDYIKSLNLANALLPYIEQLIVETWSRIAGDVLRQLDGRIAAVEGAQAPKYLPRPVEKISATRDQAGKLNEEQKGRSYREIQYDRVEEICLRGLKETDALWVSFNNYAQNEIRKSNAAYTVTKKEFDDTRNIFIIKDNEYVKRIDVEFENNKQALRKELETTLETIDTNLKNAEKDRESTEKEINDKVQSNNSKSIKYHEAIQMAREMADNSNEVLGRIYDVATHNAINEVADQMSRWGSDGGVEWAKAEMTQCDDAIKAAIELRDRQQYQQALKTAAEARWKLDFAIQKIKEKALTEISNAKASIKDAIDHQAENYRKDSLQEAEDEYKKSQDKLLDEKLKDSIEASMRSQVASRRAKDVAVVMWTNDLINKAVNEVRMTEDAGAAEYAGRLLDESQDQLASARRLADAKQFPSARLSANLAIEKAHQARYAKINRADEMIDTVRKYNGWKYDSRRLTESIVKAKTSRKLMESTDYQSANSKADEARALAASVLDLSKNSAFTEQIAQIKSLLQDVLKSGAKYYQTRKIREMLAEAEAIEGDYEIGRFDEVIIRTHKLVKDLNDTLKTNSKLVDVLIQRQLDRLSVIEEQEGSVFIQSDINKAESLLNVAGVEYKKDNYFRSYDHLRRANVVVDRLENSLKRDIYLEDLRALMLEYHAANELFSGILQISPKVLKSFTVRPDGKPQFVAIAGKLAPYDYRRKMDDLYARSKRMDVPEGMEILHREMIYVMEKTRQAAINFEKLLILDEFDQKTVNRIIDRAFDLMSDVRSRQEILSERLLHEGTTTQKI